MKNRYILLLLILNLYALAMEKGEINDVNIYKQTPLHITVLLPEERDLIYPEFASCLSKNDRILSNYDTKQACMAAKLIQLGARVDIPDQWNKTACDRIDEHKAKLPKIYEVIMAGKIFQDWNLPVPTNNEVPTMEDLIAIANSQACKEYTDRWFAASKILDKYAEEKK